MASSIAHLGGPHILPMTAPCVSALESHTPSTEPFRRKYLFLTIFSLVIGRRKLCLTIFSLTESRIPTTPRLSQDLLDLGLL